MGQPRLRLPQFGCALLDQALQDGLHVPHLGHITR
jgi:hypothetical protein